MLEAEGGLFTVDLSSNVYYRVNNDCQTDGSDSHWAVVDSHETQGEITKFTIKVILKIHRLVHVSVPFVSLAMM